MLWQFWKLSWVLQLECCHITWYSNTVMASKLNIWGQQLWMTTFLFNTTLGGLINFCRHQFLLVVCLLWLEWFATLNLFESSQSTCLWFQPKLQLFRSQKGHFKGMLFHKVIKHYVIQAGDNQGQGATEDWNLRGKQHTITRFSYSSGFCNLSFWYIHT